ncbi:Arabinose metabolism transcriptional repressor [Novipirellula galeiformis]|uniref:Arabinose metabolism transcriptional repressor n=1 Tax=Novipirellula galeiformis TaxID=2528004 RepID=A0A5C6C894_9BACT|nr:substrate-binding domain-containing protein [Novipirellula galeiformis]TWU20315.1 Arabinose metabolism transcriptional repressor [Novipirellula galeiformis]
MAAPKYKQIAQELMAEITSGHYQPTGRLPSEAQLVKRFDVSRPTAAMALRMLQDQGLIVRRAGSGTFVRQQSVAVDNGQRKIGLLVPEINETEILEAICGDLARLARLHDFSLLWCAGIDDESGERSPRATSLPSTSDPATSQSSEESSPSANALSDSSEDLDPIRVASKICKPFLDQSVSGVFFAPFEHHEKSRELNLRITDLLRQAGVSIVLLDHDIHPFPTRSEFDLVGINNLASGYVAATHLLKLGCKRLCFLAPPLAAPTITHRIAGAREGAFTHEDQLAEFQVHRLQPDNDAAIKPIAESSDAIICSNDRVAATLMQTLARLGIAVPSDIRLVGFDDVNYAQLLTVPLTTIHQPCRDIAVVAFRAMLDSIEKIVVPARHYLLPGQLVVRESCGAYQKR